MKRQKTVITSPRGDSLSGFDIIGDVHGHYEKLKALLRTLGYESYGGTWRHPEGRSVIYLGDFIDRGPGIRSVLHLVRGMCDAGDALAVMGNHEYNAVCYHTPDGSGGYLRPRDATNRYQHALTLAEFFDNRNEWGEWLEWLKSLPFYLDLGGLRAVHAAWDPRQTAVLNNATLRDIAFLTATADSTTPEFLAVETLLKGVELELPTEIDYVDPEGHKRRGIRARWWENAPLGMNYRQLSFPRMDSLPDTIVAARLLTSIPGYGEDEPPVFVGHYWMPPDSPLTPLRPNIACLDYSVAKGGPLVAYRWDGEQKLSSEKFTASRPI